MITAFTLPYFAPAQPAPGVYRGVLSLDPAKRVELPFNFRLTYKRRRPVITFQNADERIVATEVRIKGDSMIFRLPVFDTEFRTRITNGGLQGVWVNHYRKNERIIPFTAVHGDARRFTSAAGSGENIEGRWQCVFSPGASNSYPAAGLFHHVEQTAHISGTFLTETGDYRYLEGVLSHDTLLLSSFDGSRAFFFTARVRGDSIVDGMFYSGSHWQEPWLSVRNPQYRLRNADSITTVKDPSTPLVFSFPNTRGKTVSLSDKHYRNKPVIVQVMGSWCPNCMDESRYLAEVYRKHNAEGLEIVALAFEKTTDEKKAMSQVKRMKERLNLPYEVLLTGATGKDAASRALPALSGITAFPTTIFLDRDHRIVKVYTGFSGPATGKPFDEFRAETDQLVQKLLR